MARVTARRAIRENPSSVLDQALEIAAIAAVAYVGWKIYQANTSAKVGLTPASFPGYVTPNNPAFVPSGYVPAGGYVNSPSLST